MMDSNAFKTLSATGIKILLRFLQKRTWAKAPAGRGKKKTIFNNGGLSFTYTEANALGFSTSQFHAILKKLYEVGFIDIEHQGGAVARDYSRYAMSERWKDYGTDAYKPVVKKRRLWGGYDVRARMDQINKATENRSCQLRKTTVTGGNGMNQGAGKP